MIPNLASFNKYMEKCVRILIEYLANKSNWYAQFVLALQWSKLMKDSVFMHLKTHQKHQLFDLILSNCIGMAWKRVNSAPVAPKSKNFADFIGNVYELFIECESQIRSLDFPAFSKLMIECYCVSCDDPNARNEFTKLHDNEQFQQALDFLAKHSAEQAQAQSDKKKRANKVNTAAAVATTVAVVVATENNNPLPNAKKSRPNEPESKSSKQGLNICDNEK